MTFTQKNINLYPRFNPLTKYIHTMYKIASIFVACTLSFCMPSCQSTLNPDVSGQFIKFLGGALDETAFALKQSPEGEILLVGSSQSFGENEQMFVAKTDKNGNKIWQKTFTNAEIIGTFSTNPDTLAQSGRDLEILPNGNILVLGNIRSIRPEYANEALLILLELSPNGSLVESKLFEDRRIRNNNGVYLQQLADGGFMMLANTFIERDAPTSDMYMHRLDATKNTVYERIYGILNRDDQVGSLAESATADIVWVGTSNRKRNPTGGFFSDMRIIKSDQVGNLQWDFAIGENDEFSQTGRDIITLANDEGFLLVGNTNQNGTEDILLVKTNTAGQVQWQKIIGAPSGQIGGDGDQIGISGFQTQDGGFAITGSTTQGTNQDVYLIKTNATGDVEWQKRYGSQDRNDTGQMLIQSNIDGGYLIIAKIRFENNDVIGLIKTDAQGNVF